MRAGFVTCVRLGLSCMEAIYEAGGRLACAVTLRDELAVSKSGRVYLDDFCRERAVPLIKARNVNDSDTVAALRAARLDWLFIIGWSQIAKPEVLQAPLQGVLGIHPTLLPVGRGRAAVPWAILHDLRETGVTLFKLDQGVDTGPIVAQVRIPLFARETAASLYEKIMSAHRDLILASWSDLTAGKLRPVPQDETRATVWPGRRPEDGRLDPAMSIVEADRLVRAVTRPYPGAFFDLPGQRIRIWRASPETDGAAAVGMEPNLAVSHPLLRFNDGALRLLEWSIEQNC